MRKSRPSVPSTPLAALTADVQACQALCRAGLQALAVLSASAARATDLALEREADLAADPAVAHMLATARAQLAAGPAEFARIGALERALVEAAEALETRGAA